MLRDAPTSIPINFITEDHPLGTGGAIRQAAIELGMQQLLVMNGDSFCATDLRELWAAGKQWDILMTCVEVNNTSRYGAVAINEKTNEILQFNEKNTANVEGLINAGMYVIKTNSIIDYPSSDFSFETDFLPFFNGRCGAYLVSAPFIDIGTPESYQALNENFRSEFEVFQAKSE